ncbi:hypothetical protein QFW96_26995 [Saccharopolyspora sp. TS4A08]|uniref:Uncharacterized protein n=1 Tax=Saccharopolyspora ipomoeae TaxID=3042027 RepID=A0ABT6PWR7_9PSEU|nr:hypothetical protein [Saccharopolyspora sp. TS4A08]MDI2032295.1 hypothetical protein [Saccharopolyspora sp. TS4A08]
MTSAIDGSPDESGLSPICSRARFTELIEGLVADFAPKVFAIVQEYGDRVDAEIIAWGIAFDDRAEVVDVDGGLRMSLETPERALVAFRSGDAFTEHLVWVDPRAATRTDQHQDEQ